MAPLHQSHGRTVGIMLACPRTVRLCQSGEHMGRSHCPVSEEAGRHGVVLEGGWGDMRACVAGLKCGVCGLARAWAPTQPCGAMAMASDVPSIVALFDA